MITKSSITSLTQIWDSTGINYNCDTGLPDSTGKWRHLTTSDLQPQSQFSSAVFNFSSGQTTIPIGVKSWSIGVISGGVFINNAGPMPIGASINGGGYGTSTSLEKSIQISGDARAFGIVMWEI